MTAKKYRSRAARSSRTVRANGSVVTRSSYAGGGTSKTVTSASGASKTVYRSAKGVRSVYRTPATVTKRGWIGRSMPLCATVAVAEAIRAKRGVRIPDRTLRRLSEPYTNAEGAFLPDALDAFVAAGYISGWSPCDLKEADVIGVTWDGLSHAATRIEAPWEYDGEAYRLEF